MTEKKYQMCTRCVMDTSDPEILFDEQGVCNHCHEFDDVTSKRWFPNEDGKQKLADIFSKIRQEGKNKEYDCVIGLSGGVDSSYLAMKLKDYNLRPLVMHVDAGWNSEVAVNNIEQLVKYCGFELYTHVMDWEEVRDLQVAYLKAGVANQDVVQDHAFFATMYHFAVKNKISYILSGDNIATESVFPRSWHHAAMDAINLHAIHKKFGTISLKNYKTISFMEYYFYYPFIRKMKIIRPFNYMPYDKKAALIELKKKVDYKQYEYKHGESRFTKFFQNYYLPVKFGMDKRRLHLSSLILSGQLNREQALQEIEKPLYTPNDLAEDKAYIAKKLSLSEAELDLFISAPSSSFRDYDNWDYRYSMLKKAQSILEKIVGRDIKN